MRVQRLDPFEFAVAVIVAGMLSVLICAAFGAPTRGARAEVLRLGLSGLLAQAREQAVDSGSPVVICPVDLPFSCNGGDDWSRGWIGFTDGNRSGQFDGDDELIRRDLALPDGLRLYAVAGRGPIRIEPSAGRVVGGGEFVVCDPEQPDQPASLKLSGQGRWQLEAADTAAARQCLERVERPRADIR